jgi:transketolase C-terminal domain/subunit
MVDFLVSRSPIVSTIQAPVAVIVEAKKGDITTGLGQCVAEMVAAQLFNQQNQQSISTIYGSVSNGTLWRFLKLEEQTVTLDLTDYPLPPVDQILGFLVWMVQEG